MLRAVPSLGLGNAQHPVHDELRSFGPAWSNSVFEDNAEFALGMSLSMEQQRDAIRIKSEELLGLTDGALHDAIKAWIDSIGVTNEAKSQKASAGRTSKN